LFEITPLWKVFPADSHMKGLITIQPCSPPALTKIGWLPHYVPVYKGVRVPAEINCKGVEHSCLLIKSLHYSGPTFISQADTNLKAVISVLE